MRKRIFIAASGVLFGTLLAVAPMVIIADEANERRQRLEDEYYTVSEENRRLVRQIEDLQSYIDRFNSEQRFREKIVREELGYIQPGEVVYRLHDTVLEGHL